MLLAALLLGFPSFHHSRVPPYKASRLKVKSTVGINLEQKTSDTKLHVRRRQMTFCYVGTSDGQWMEDI